MKKKFLVFQPIIAPYRIDFFNELNKRFDSRICLFHRNLLTQKFDYSKIEEQLCFTPIYIEKNKGFFYWIKDILFQLISFKPDVVLCSEFSVATLFVVLFNFLTFRKYRILSVVDDSYNMVAENNQFSWKHKWATHVLVPMLDNVINVEPRVAEFYQKKYGKGIYMPIIVDDLRYRENLKRILPISESYIKKYGLEGRKVLLFVGRLVKIKNVSFAINAFVGLDLDKTTFVIVGDGPEEENLKALASKKSNILFTGRLEGDELYAWYNIAQVFTLPSKQEPFGAVTNEALLGGCYALISRNAGSNCLVEENVNGNVIDPYDKKKYESILDKAFEKALPIESPLQLRKNAMNESFHDCMERLISQMKMS